MLQFLIGLGFSRARCSYCLRRHTSPGFVPLHRLGGLGRVRIMSIRLLLLLLQTLVLAFMFSCSLDNQVEEKLRIGGCLLVRETDPLLHLLLQRGGKQRSYQSLALLTRSIS